MTTLGCKRRHPLSACALATAAFASLLAVPGVAHASDVPYRRWLDNKTYTCAADGVVISNLDMEFSSLPVDAQFMHYWISNGVVESHGPFTVEQTTGTAHMAPAWWPNSGYPVVLDLRADTLVNGVVVYRSTLHIACTGDSGGNVSPINEVVAPLPPTGSSPTMLWWAVAITIAGAATLITARRRNLDTA